MSAAAQPPAVLHLYALTCENMPRPGEGPDRGRSPSTAGRAAGGCSAASSVPGRDAPGRTFAGRTTDAPRRR